MAALRADAPLDLRTPAAALVVVGAQLGDRAALNDVLCALEGPLWSHIRLLVRDDDLARDVLQEVMLTIARKLGTLRDPRWLRVEIPEGTVKSRLMYGLTRLRELAVGLPVEWRGRDR